jgi:hypothetical protein
MPARPHGCRSGPQRTMRGAGRQAAPGIRARNGELMQISPARWSGALLNQLALPCLASRDEVSQRWT